jgi:hypothetical protein
MVVILQDAALVFWMEYRRYVRTRRYWVLALTTLALGMLLCLIAALVAARIPQAPLRFLGASVYLPATIVGWFAAIASVVHNPLSVRMLQDVYKTRPLTDLYLTELHPLGVVLGRAAATTALTGLILLMLTPAGLWLLQLIGAPLGAWVPIALLALVSYFFGSCLEAYTLRSLALGEEQFGPPRGVRSGYVSMLSLGFLAGWVLASVAIFFPLWNWLARLPLWVFTPPTAPFLLFVGIQGDGWVHALLGALFAVGFALWVAVAAAQWRDWWSDGAYRVLRWGGTAFWLVFVSVHAAYFAQAFVRDAARRGAGAVPRTDHRDAAQPFGRAVDGLLWRRASSEAAAVCVALSVGRAGVAVGASLARGRRALPCGRAGVGRVGRADEVALLDDLLLGSVRVARSGS